MSDTTTLYLSDTNVRLMVTRGKRIVKLADMPMNINLSEIDTPEKETQLAEKIKYLFQSNKLGARKVILGISGLHCLTRPVSLPDLPKAMLDEAVTREARRVLPVPIEQLYISWQTISTSEGKIQAFMVAMPRNIADKVIKIISQAGFKPYIMDIKPLALARLARENSAVIVDVQPSEFDIVIVMKGIPQPIRTIPFPQETTSLKERLAIVKDELERTVQFYNANNAESKIEPGFNLLVSGELADEVELSESIGKALKFKVAPLASPLKCLKHLDPSHHLANVGLALKELVRESGPLLPNFNTLPNPYLPKQVSLNKVLAVPAAAAAIGLLILLGLTVRDAAASLDTKKMELDSAKLMVDKRTAQRKEMTNNIAAMQTRLAATDADRKNYTAALNDLTAMGNKMNNDLTATVYNIVENLGISSLSLAANRATVQGQASSEQEVMQYVRKLAVTGRFKEITISNLSVVGDVSENDTTAMSYALTLTLKGGKQ